MNNLAKVRLKHRTLRAMVCFESGIFSKEINSGLAQGVLHITQQMRFVKQIRDGLAAIVSLDCKRKL
jgi:hypothetical protein